MIYLPSCDSSGNVHKSERIAQIFDKLFTKKHRTEFMTDIHHSFTLKCETKKLGDPRKTKAIKLLCVGMIALKSIIIRVGIE